MRFDAEVAESPVSRRVLQKEYTRRRILDMAVALMRNCGEEAVTLRAVAFEAEVTERTVYRHFKSRDVLLQSVWRRIQELIGSQALPESADALVERPRSLFPPLDQERELVRAYLRREQPRVGRTRAHKERQQAFVRCVRDELEYLDKRSLRRRAAVVNFIASPYAWQFMQDFWGFSGEEAARAAAEALEILINRRLAY